jgi:transposase
VRDRGDSLLVTTIKLVSDSITLSVAEPSARSRSSVSIRSRPRRLSSLMMSTAKAARRQRVEHAPGRGGPAPKMAPEILSST